ncbi:aminoglycoside 6-adenylyltransferase [Cognatiyoonia sp. IB215446]|uniref:nucleotidyltransferase domain-containing protein n=1 Tax=Cognatiyoonia sp. IB215446 TaxID=3097355 RepID=UPI002A0E80DC|nr:nucleotidyltransferase domain-containing protein [Cognatiyoonia sp. IB215446]MDX8347982.1 aminoglycoside 6-adenylyltransferase [Cognatiyoonia sp. IB215446]
MDHTDVIATITKAVRDAPGIQALFLSGSYGNGMADAYSDIDFVMVADDGASDAVAAIWREAVAQTGEIVLWWDRTTVPVLINAITEDWTRTDVIILKPEQMRGHTQSTLKVLFDHDGIYETLPEIKASPIADSKRFIYQVEEFIRILGLLHLAAGREEYINGVLGIFHLRNKLVDLLIAETDAPHRGGILHLNRLITDEQKALLVSMPPPVPERQAMIDAHLAYAAAFLPRARKRAEAIGAEWPERFEAVTWERLADTLGIERPY